VTWGSLAGAVDAARPHAVPLAAPGSASTAPRSTALPGIIEAARLAHVTRRLALTIPAFRAGHAKITKQPGTWPLATWRGDYKLTEQPAWLRNPDPRRTYTDLVSATLDDAVFYDRAFWHVTRRGVDGFPLAFEQVKAERVTETPTGWLVDGKPADQLPGPGPVILTDGRILESFIPMTWNGLGGMRGAGAIVVDLALALLTTAANMAKSPMPQAALRPEAPTRQLDDAEIDQLLDDWEVKRAARATAYLQGVTLETIGWSAKELQLVEAREHSALEIARALALPAAAVDASNGSSLEYSTTVENRRDLVEAVRLWTAPLEQALTLHATPRGIDVRLDVTSYLRDDPATRMQVWTAGIASGVLTVDEARAQEPLATGGTR
jgi:hypothetical protein